MEWIGKSDYLPALRESIDPARYGIGLIGCGSIANQAHLPAYRKIGLPVNACYDINEEAARTTAEKFGIPFWTSDIRRFLERENVSVIDMAVHPHVRMGLLEEIAAAPRPVLCQKPLAVDLRQARELGEFAKARGIKLGVNQQARWAPAHRALRALLDKGVVGELFGIHHVMRSFQDQAEWWWTKLEHFNIIDHGIHYIDLCRHFAQSPCAGHGEWTRLHCSTAMQPGQHAVSPLIYSANVEFGPVGGRSPLLASLQFNNIARGSTSHSYTWWADGTEGSVWCHHDKLFVSLASESSTVHEIRLKGSWFPDGFAGSMAAFIAALDSGEKLPVTPDDNYGTIAMASAMIVSSQEGRTVDRTEMTEGRC